MLHSEEEELTAALAVYVQDVACIAELGASGSTKAFQLETSARAFTFLADTEGEKWLLSLRHAFAETNPPLLLISC